MDLTDLYQELILDHNKNPRHFAKLAESSHHAEGKNPLCGDHYEIFAKIEGSKVIDISFDGAGCAISKASASLMTESVCGKDLNQTKKLFELFHDMMTQDDWSPDADKLGKLAVFAGVRQYPSRVKCAALAWHTLMAALEKKADVVSTESEKTPGGYDSEKF